MSNEEISSVDVSEQEQLNESRLSADSLGFSGTEIVEFGPYKGTVSQALEECPHFRFVKPELVAMLLQSGMVEFVDENVEDLAEEFEPETPEAKKKLN